MLKQRICIVLQKGFKQIYRSNYRTEITGSWVVQGEKGITINASESPNAALESITKKTEMPAQTIEMCLYHLGSFLSTEILLGYCGLGGSHKLKYLHLKQ